MARESQATAKLVRSTGGAVRVELAGDWRLDTGLPNATEVLLSGIQDGVTGSVRFVDEGLTAWNADREDRCPPGGESLS